MVQRNRHRCAYHTVSSLPMSQTFCDVACRASCCALPLDFVGATSRRHSRRKVRDARRLLRRIIVNVHIAIYHRTTGATPPIPPPVRDFVCMTSERRCLAAASKQPTMIPIARATCRQMRSDAWHAAQVADLQRHAAVHASRTQRREPRDPLHAETEKVTVILKFCYKAQNATIQIALRDASPFLNCENDR